MRTKENETDLGKRRWDFFWGLAILGIASLAYRVLVHQHLEQTAMLFIGLPTLIAAFLALMVHPRSSFGSAMLWTTIALLMSGPLLGEGFICILMAAPLFYGVVLMYFGLVSLFRYHPSERRDRHKLPLFVLPFVLMSFEGVNETLSFRRAETVVVERVIEASPERVVANLARAPELPGDLPFFFQLGFPLPVEASGSGLEPGDQRRIHFAGGEGKPGDLLMEITDVAPDHVTFRIIQDTSHIAHWMDWREATFEWREKEDGKTWTRITLRYDRRLDPAWYFGPWQRYGVSLAGGYLLENLVTPPPARASEP